MLNLFSIKTIVVLLLSSHSILIGQFFLQSQADIDAFDRSLTTAANVTIGTSGPSDIENLRALSNLTQVTGTLRIASNPNLASLDGLQNITSVRQLEILSNASLEDIDELNITEINGSLFIKDNTRLQNIDAISLLTAIASDIDIRQNDSLENLDGLCNVTDFDGALIIEGNNSLKNLNGLKNINDFSLFQINRNENLCDCCAVIDLYKKSKREGNNNFVIVGNPPCQSTFVFTQECDFDFFETISNPCIGENNGVISFIVNGDQDKFPSSYLLEDKTNGTTISGILQEPNLEIDNLGEGCYTMTMISNEMDTVVKDDLILSAALGNIFEVFEVRSVNSSNGLSNGQINVVTAGGTPPYSVEWSGTNLGVISDITSDTISIFNREAGEYSVLITDALGKTIILSLTLLDDVVPIIPCTQALDIVILNDVSGSVDDIEYQESKEFYVNFMNEINLGFGPEDSRVSIVEWSTSVRLITPITGDISELVQYADQPRTFSGGNNEIQAMNFAEGYLSSVARLDAVKVIVFSTDGFPPFALPNKADQLKAMGFNIATMHLIGLLVIQ